jgi:hypothetical protein
MSAKPGIGLGCWTTQDTGRASFQNTPDEVYRARLTVCWKAIDVEDARLILDMLGLLPPSVTAAQGFESAVRSTVCGVPGW